VADLAWRLSEIFLREGLDRFWVICPSRRFVARLHRICACAASKSARSAQARRAVPTVDSRVFDGGHAYALPTLRLRCGST
jgi:hypothetical protein